MMWTKIDRQLTLQLQKKVTGSQILSHRVCTLEGKNYAVNFCITSIFRMFYCS